MTSETTSSGIGFIAPASLGSVGVDYVVSSNDADGTLVVTATIEQDTKTKVVKFKLSGYQTTSERKDFEDQQAVNDAAILFINGALNAKDDDSELVSTPSSLSDKENILPSLLNGVNKSKDDLGFTKPSISKGSIEKKVKFELSGFQTQAQANDQEIVKGVIQAFKDNLNAVDEGESIANANVSSLGDKKSTLPDSITGTLNEVTLGFDEPELNTAIASYEVSPNNDVGTIIVTVTITKRSAEGKVQFKLSGYLTTDKKDVDDASKIINNDVTTGYSGKGLGTVTEWTAFTSGTFGIDTSSIPAGVAVDYKHPGVNEDKSFSVTFKVAKGLINKEFDKGIIATGFNDQKDVDDAYKVINNDVSTSYNGKALVEVADWTPFPSETFGINTSSIASGVVVKYKHLAVNSDGSFIVTFKITKGIKSKTFNKNIMASDINDHKAVDAAFKIINDDLSTGYSGETLAEVTDWTPFPSGTFGIDTSEIPADVIIKYQHPAVNEDKSFSVTFKVTKGSISNEFIKEITTTGFSDQKVVDDASKVIGDDVSTGYSGEALAAVTEWTPFPSGTFGIDTSGISADVVVEYKHLAVSSNGSFIVTFKVTKGIKSKTFDKNIMASNINDYEAVNAAFNIINNHSNASYDGETLAEITEWTAFSSGTFGIDTSSIPADVVVEYKHSIINSNGSFEVTFKVAKGLASKEFTKEIIASGFEEIAKTTNDPKENNNTVILATTIPIGLLFLAGISFLIFRKMKRK